MAEALTLYTNPMSRGRIARWMLEEVGQPYDVKVLDFGTDAKDEAYLAINPMGKVPAITHGDKVVTECAAICAYLADAFPEAGLAPDQKDRADYYRWLFFAAGPVEAAITANSFGWKPSDDQQMSVGFGNFDLVVDALEKAVSGGGWLAGERFTAADLYVGAHLSWGVGFGTLPKRDAFVAFVEKVNARPAAQRANALDDKLMAERHARPA